MKTLDQQMAFYASYHRDARNKLSHFIGVPMIVFGVMLALSWLRLTVADLDISLAMVTTAWVLVYYLILDVPLGLTVVVILGALLYAADTVSRMGLPVNAAVFVVAFGGGWVIQLIGHVYEGRKPALVDNLFQVFVAPIFLAAEAMFALGLRRALHDRVETLSHEFDRPAPASASPNTPLAAD